MRGTVGVLGLHRHRCWGLQVSRGPVLGVGSALSCPPSPSAPSPGPWRAEAPGGEAAAVRELSARLLGLAGNPARDPDPSVYLALRLAGDHDLREEERYLARLRDAFQRRYGR